MQHSFCSQGLFVSALTTRAGWWLSHWCSSFHEQTCVASSITLVEPGADAQVLQYIFLYHAEGRLGRCKYPEIIFPCRCSLKGDIRETLEIIKGRKSFSFCHLIIKTCFSSHLHPHGFFHLKKMSSREGENYLLFLKENLCQISCYKLTALQSYTCSQTCSSSPRSTIKADEIDL